MAEQVFLFIWAMVSNTKDLVIEYTLDLLDIVLKKQKKKSASDEEKRRQQKRAYFRRLKRQMGYFSPEKKAASSTSTNKKDSEQKVEEETNKIESLENELMMLKMELASIPAQKKEDTISTPQAKEPLAVSTPQVVSAPPPPPPPMPVNSTVFSPPPPPPMSKVSTKGTTAGLPKNTPLGEKTAANPASLSMVDIIASAKNHKLRPVKDSMPRSPGGTPLKTKPQTESKKMCFQNELFAAIKSKFKNAQEDSPAKKLFSNVVSDDEESDEDSWSPKKKPVNSENKENAGKAQSKLRAASPIPKTPLREIQV